MLATNPADELQKFEEVTRRLQPLFDRQDADWKKMRGDQFQMPKSEGKWDNVTSNRAPAESGRVIDWLSNARRRLYIPPEKSTTDKPGKKARKNMASTERLAVGMITLADELAYNIPESVTFQHGMAWNAVVRGWLVPVVYLYFDKDGKLTVYLQCWDVRNIRWISGTKRVLWVGHERFTTKEGLQEDYPKWNGRVDSNGMCRVVDLWDIDQHGITDGSEWLLEPEEHGLDHIPVRIRPGKSTHLVTDGSNSTSIQHMGESFMAANRNLWEPECRMLSYKLTEASMKAKAPFIMEFDGSKTKGQAREFESEPFVKGNSIPLDTSKGEKFIGFLTPPGGMQIESMQASIETMAGKAGLTKVAFGQIDQALPAQGIDILYRATMDAVMPFKQLMEEAYVWVAGEIVRQFTDGDFEATEVEGYDKGNNRYRVEVSPSEIDVNWRFECKLSPDLMRDDAFRVGIVKDMIALGLLSKRSGRELVEFIEDTEQEEENITLEQAEQLTDIKMFRFIQELAKNDPQEAYQAMNRLKAERAARPPQPGGNGGAPAMLPPGQTPEQGNGMMPSNTPPAEDMMSEQMRLARLGLVAGS